MGRLDQDQQDDSAERAVQAAQAEAAAQGLHDDARRIDAGVWRQVASRLLAIPVAFCGVGVYRAWLSIFFRYGAFADIDAFDYFLFEGAIGVMSLVLAFFAVRITPLWSNNRMTAITAVLMMGGSALVVASTSCHSAALITVGLLAAGAGLAVLILMWAEFYGSLNPIRVAIYHALAIFAGEFVKWTFMGMAVSQLMFFAVALPAVSLVQVRLGMRHLSAHELPRGAGVSRRVFPWKPILLMSACTFAGGLGSLPAQSLLAGNVAGAMAVTALVFLGALSQARWFNFDTVYTLAFPLFIVGFLFISPAFAQSSQLSAFCYDAGYTMLSMFIMLVMSNITYRFGINAVLINGIERGLRYLVELAGWLVGAYVSAHAAAGVALAIFNVTTVAIIVVFALVFVTERKLSAKWGIKVEDLGDDETAREARIAMRVSDLASERNLTPREEEVLQLLASGKTMAEMEAELFVAGGTLKAHINHIYKKFDVHSRKELLDLCHAE